ncbi:MAG: hypothetical protein OHK0012_04870 [Synechococcales cyanobacterium]
MSGNNHINSMHSEKKICKVLDILDMHSAYYRYGNGVEHKGESLGKAPGW